MSRPSRSARLGLFLAASTCFIVVGRCAPALAEPGQPTVIIADSSRETHLRIELGCIRRGGTARQTLVVANGSTTPALLARITTTCECLSVEPLPISLEPGGRQTIAIACDFSDDPDFTGSLAIEVALLDSSGTTRCAFTTALRVEG